MGMGHGCFQSSNKFYCTGLGHSITLPCIVSVKLNTGSACITYLKSYQNCIIGPKATAIFLNCWILPSDGVALRRVSACSLRSWIDSLYQSRISHTAVTISSNQSYHHKTHYKDYLTGLLTGRATPVKDPLLALCAIPYSTDETV